MSRTVTTRQNCYYDEEESAQNQNSYVGTNNYYEAEQEPSLAKSHVYEDFPQEPVNNYLKTQSNDDNYSHDTNENNTTSKTKSISKNDQEHGFSEDYFFNERFQSLISNYDSFSANNQATIASLSDCNSDFTYAVETFGKIIISEKNLPDDKKTIKPINVGGIAGGEKFIHRGILFKYAIDPVIAQKDGRPVYLYGGNNRNDELAMKAAGNELKALHRFVAACQHVKELHTPLMSLCDFYGFRLIAMSLLPITDSTLIYGSSDAGATVHDSNPTFRRSIKAVAEMLNLKPHYVADTLVYTAGDVEGHEGKDGLLYVVDFGRLYPPEAPGVVANAGGCLNNNRSVFYQHLRPEFVKMNPAPLCSDAFTAWQKQDPNKTQHSQEITEATERLVHQVIPKCAEDLDGLENTRAETMSSITEQIHRRGINLRHMGLIRPYCRHPAMKLTLLTEMWVRGLKSVIYRILRLSSFQQRILSSIQAKRIVSQIITLILHPGPFHDWYWREHSSKCGKEIVTQYDFDFIEEIPSFKWTLTEKYGTKALSKDEADADVQHLVMIKVGLQRLSQLCCFAVAQQLIDSEFKMQTVTEVDIVSVEPRIKYTSLIHLCDGLASLKKGLTLPISERLSFLRMMMDSERHLSKAWSLHPENETIIYNRAIVCFQIAKINLTPEWSDANLTTDHIADGLTWLENAGNSFEDAYSMLQVVDKYIPKDDENQETKRKNFEMMQQDCMVNIARSRLECAVYETKLYKALNPYSISIFERAAKWFLEVNKRDPKIVDQLVQDAFIHFTGIWTVGVLFLCTLSDDFKKLIAGCIETHASEITEIGFGTGIVYAPQLITATQTDILIDLLGSIPIKILDLSHCVCLHEKSVIQLLQHYSKSVTLLKVTGIQMTESLMSSIGSYGPGLQSIVMKKCNLTNEVILTWAPTFWNRLGKNQFVVPSKLEEVDVEGNPQLDDEAILAFTKKLTNLKKLNLKSCNMTEEAIEEIKKLHPLIELHHTTGDLGISHPLSFRQS